MSDLQNIHLLSEIEGVEYQIEVIGDEVVVWNFSDAEVNMYQMLGMAAGKRGKFNAEQFEAHYDQLISPNKPLFSFPATPELKALVFAANEWFDSHGEEANASMDERIQALAEPEIRKALQSAREAQN